MNCVLITKPFLFDRQNLLSVCDVLPVHIP
jgi:hypothetical protein